MSARDTSAWIDVFATLVLLFVVAVQTWTLFDKVHGTYNDNVLTFDMRMPTWPFFAVAWAGDASAVLLIAIRTYRLIFHPEEMPKSPRSRPWSRRHEHRRRRHPRICRAVRADAAARAGRHGDGPRRRHRLRLSRRLRPGAEDGRPDLDAHGDRLHLRRDSDVPADGRLRQQFRHEPRTVPRRQRLRRPSARRARHRHGRRPAAALPRSAARRWRRPRRFPPSPIRKCAASAIRNPSPPA